jgi:hypothetical protein
MVRFMCKGSIFVLWEVIGKGFKETRLKLMIWDSLEGLKVKLSYLNCEPTW